MSAEIAKYRDLFGCIYALGAGRIKVTKSFDGILRASTIPAVTFKGLPDCSDIMLNLHHCLDVLVKQTAVPSIPHAIC
jgi:hypothetical protein